MAEGEKRTPRVVHQGEEERSSDGTPAPTDTKVGESGRERKVVWDFLLPWQARDR
jgi:hypothetical protein